MCLDHLILYNMKWGKFIYLQFCLSNGLILELRRNQTDACQNDCQLHTASHYYSGDIIHLDVAVREEVFQLILWCFCHSLYKRMLLPIIIKITRQNVILTVVISHHYFLTPRKETAFT